MTEDQQAPPRPCEHRDNINVAVEVSFMEDTRTRMAEVTITCGTCGKPMEFVGLPVGLSWYQATGSYDRLTANLPIVPQGETMPEGLTGYSIRRPGPAGPTTRL